MSISPLLVQTARVLLAVEPRSTKPATMHRGRRPRWQTSGNPTQPNCEGGVDVVGVVTPLVRGGAQVLHGDQVVELSVLLEVHEKEEVEEDGEGQIEVESERGELKERRTCTWMT